jgi:hypothetical protein
MQSIMKDKNALTVKLAKAIEAGIFTEFQAFAVYRCCFFNEQIADESIGNLWRKDINELLERKA